MTDGPEWTAPDSGGSTGPVASPGGGGPDRAPGPAEPAATGTSGGQPGSGAAPDHGVPPGHGGPLPGYAAPPGHGGPPPGYGPPQGYGGPPYGGYGAPPPPKPGIIPLRPLGVSELLDGAITYMRRNPRPVIGLSLIVSFISQTIVAVASYFSLDEVMRLSADPQASQTLSPGALLAPYATLLPTIVVTSFAILVLAGMLTTVVGRAVLGGSASIGQAWRDVLPRLHVLLATALVTLLLTILAMTLPLVPVTLLVLNDAPLAASVAAGVLGALVAIGAAVWIFVSFAFATPAVVLEGCGVADALVRSYRLVKSAWWRTFGLLMLAQLITGLIGGAVQTPFSIAGAAVLFTGGPEPTATTRVLYLVLLAIGGIIAGTLTYPFSAGVTALLYVDRRMRREGLDLELQTTSERHQGADLSRQELIGLWQPSPAATGAAAAPPGWGPQ